MAVGIGSMTGSLGIVVSRKKPGHFVALSEDGRIDAILNQGGKLADLLEKRAAINVKEAQRGPADGSLLSPAGTVKTVDPYDVTIAMPAADGEPVVSDAERDAWSRMRVSYDVIIDAPPFKLGGTLMLLASQDPSSIAERGTDLFIALFNPHVEVAGVTLRDVPRDSVLVNRSHIRRVTATAKR
jgi:hypothetical protein